MSITAPNPDSVEFRLSVLERKLDVALRTIALLTVSTKPAIDWMDAGLAQVEDPKQIGVPQR